MRSLWCLPRWMPRAATGVSRARDTSLRTLLAPTAVPAGWSSCDAVADPASSSRSRARSGGGRPCYGPHRRRHPSPFVCDDGDSPPGMAVDCRHGCCRRTSRRKTLWWLVRCPLRSPVGYGVVGGGFPPSVVVGSGGGGGGAPRWQWHRPVPVSIRQRPCRQRQAAAHDRAWDGSPPGPDDEPGHGLFGVGAGAPRPPRARPARHPAAGIASGAHHGRVRPHRGGPGPPRVPVQLARQKHHAVLRRPLGPL